MVRRLHLVRLLAVVPVTAATALTGLSVASAATGTVTGTVFRDVNGDGVRQAPEPAFSGIAVRVTDAAGGAVLGTATTDASGRWSVGPVTAGSVTVTVTAGGTGRSFSTGTDSDVAANGTATVPLNAATVTVNAGIAVDFDAATTGTPLKFEKQLGYNGPAGLYAYGMAYDATTNTVLVGDYWNSRWQRYSTTGTRLGIFGKRTTRGIAGGICFPYDIDVDTAAGTGRGDVYVADQDCSRVVVYDTAGTYKSTIGQGGTQGYGTGCGAGAMLIPTHVLVNPNNGLVYVSDPRCRQVYVYNKAGVFQFEFDMAAAGGSATKVPRGLDVGADGLIYVAEQSDHRILVFNPDGSYVRQWTGTDFRFRDLRGVQIDRAANRIYVVAAYYNNVFAYDMTTGAQLLRWSRPGPAGTWDSIRWPALDGKGNFWISDLYGYTIHHLDAAGNSTTWTQAPQPPPRGGFRLPRDVSVSPANKVFVVDTFANQVLRFNPNGTCTTEANCTAYEATWGRREIAGANATGFGYPRAMVYAEGGVWIGDNNNAVLKYDDNGVFQLRFGSLGTAEGQFRGGVQGIDVANGQVVVTDVLNGRLQVFTTTGTLVRAMGGTGPTTDPATFTNPRGLVLRGDEAYVLDLRHRIAVWNYKTGTYIRQIKPTCAGTGFGDARFITFDPLGRTLVVADTNNKRVVKLDPTTGACTVLTTGTEVPKGPFWNPRGVDFGPDGRLYIVDDSRRFFSYTY